MNYSLGKYKLKINSLYLRNLLEAFKKTQYFSLFDSRFWNRLTYPLDHRIHWFQKMWMAEWSVLQREFRCFLSIPTYRTRGRSTRTEENRYHGDITHLVAFSYHLMRLLIKKTSLKAYDYHASGYICRMKTETPQPSWPQWKWWFWPPVKSHQALR